jgi:acyl-CoA thioester hydrolase
VRYGETDQMGFCYYAPPPPPPPPARVELLRSKGVSYKMLEEEGVLLPVRTFSIKYISPSKYDDLLKIETEISKLESSRIEFTYQIRNEKKDLIATAVTELVFLDSGTMKPINAPEKIQTLV